MRERSGMEHGRTTGIETTRPKGTPRNVTHEEIARRAHELFIARGAQHGHAVEDWLQAERELRDRVH